MGMMARGAGGLGPGQAPAVSSPRSPACMEPMLWFANTDVGSTETSKGSGAAQGPRHSAGTEILPGAGHMHGLCGQAKAKGQGAGWGGDESYYRDLGATAGGLWREPWGSGRV